MKWRKIILQYADKNPHMKLNAPASDHAINTAEKRLNISFPTEFKELLKEFDGDGWFVFSVAQIVETNEMLRKAYDSYMPLDSLLFIAGNGCGDYYGYPVTRDGVKDGEIFIWEHEYDNRVFKACGLEDMIVKYYNNEI